ncbi:MAG: hypothetical protein ACOX6Y_12800 [Christensenellales bacterium]
MTGSSGFLDYYHQTLRDWVTGADIPPDIKEQFVFESLVKQQAGREVYFVTRIADGKRAVLRVTAEGQAEDIRAEKEILNRLHHPAIPRLLGAWEHQGRGYLARECFEGEDLYSFVRRHGPMSFEQPDRYSPGPVRCADLPARANPGGDPPGHQAGKHHPHQ